MTVIIAWVVVAWWFCQESFRAVLTIAELIVDRAAVTP